MSSWGFIGRLGRHFQRLMQQQNGGTTVMVAVAAPVIMGGLALAIDAGYLYVQKRTVQQQADVAALGAAASKAKGVQAIEDLRAIATQDARRNGFAASGVSAISIFSPPTSGGHTTNTTAVEAIIETEVQTFFARYVGLASASVRGRAVAGYTVSPFSGGGCVLALHPTAAQSLRFQGSGAINAPNCTAISNSNASNSVFVGGSERLIAQAVYTVGGVEVGPSASIDLANGSHTNKVASSDPYANLSVPATGACDQTNFSVKGNNPNRIMSPGTYCNGIDIGGSGTVYLKKGTYVIKGGDLKVGGTARVRCGDCTAAADGVSFVLTTGLKGDVGTVSIAGTTDVQFSAPSGVAAGSLRGVAIFQDRTAEPGNAANLTGSSNMRISGAIYMPVADINYSGTSDLPDGKACVAIIGRIVEVQGNSRLALTDCQTMGVHKIDAGVSTPILLE